MKRNCWTCCYAVNETVDCLAPECEGVGPWIETTHDLSDPAAKCPHDADGCPGWEAKAIATTPEPPPAAGTGRPIWELVVEDMKARDEFGREKYGTALKAGDGRRSLVDAYQEALDLAVYLRKAIEEGA